MKIPFTQKNGLLQKLEIKGCWESAFVLKIDNSPIILFHSTKPNF